jgi:hypothetical protein
MEKKELKFGYRYVGGLHTGTQMSNSSDFDRVSFIQVDDDVGVYAWLAHSHGGRDDGAVWVVGVLLFQPGHGIAVVEE